MKIELDEAELKYSNEKHNFDMQLKLLSERGKLHESETKKISDLNAELFGHSNNKQKIKHLSQLKEENISLKEVLIINSEQVINK